MTKTLKPKTSVTVKLQGDNKQLANLCGPLDANLKQIANSWDVSLNRRGSTITLKGEQAQLAADAIEWFHHRARQATLSIDDIQLGLVAMGVGRTVAERPGAPARI